MLNKGSKQGHLQFMETPKTIYKYAQNALQGRAQKRSKHKVYKTFIKQPKSLNETWQGGQNMATLSSDQGPKAETQ